jgi:hypothetical protein
MGVYKLVYMYIWAQHLLNISKIRHTLGRSENRQYNQIDCGVWARLWKACMRMLFLHVSFFYTGHACSPGSVFYTYLFYTQVFYKWIFLQSAFFLRLLYPLAVFFTPEFFYTTYVFFSCPGCFLQASFFTWDVLPSPGFFYTNVFLRLSFCTGHVSSPGPSYTKFLQMYIHRAYSSSDLPSYW